MNLNIYQHYRPEEAGLIDQIFGWMQQVGDFYTPYLTPFLTPREATICQQIVNRSDEVHYKVDGGYPLSERQRILLYPPYYQDQENDLELAFLTIKYPIKFADISHGKILGSLLNTGIERNRLGDFITDGEQWQIIVDHKMQDYLIQSVQKIGNVGVRLEAIERFELVEPVEEWESQMVIVASMRLDNLISKVYNFSRQRAKEAVSAGLVKVNFMEVSRSDQLLGLEDIVSVRRSGRFRIRSVDGMTKKDNFRLTIEKLII